MINALPTLLDRLSASKGVRPGRRIRRLAAAATLAALLCSCGGPRTASAPAAFDWRSYEGTTIHVLACEHPWTDFMKRRLPLFTSLTGITVKFESYPEDQFRVKRTVEMISGITDIDAFMIMPGNSLSDYAAKRWVLPLDRFIKDVAATWRELDLGDFYPRALESGFRYGHHYTLPILIETSILAYNKRIFAKYGLKAPATMAELEETARKIREGSGGKLSGITLRGNGASATSQWCDFMHSFGGDWLAKDGTAAVDSPESIASLNFYGRLLRNYGPRDATRNGWYESLSAFMRGEAAMIYDANVFRSNYEDPAQSTVYKDVGYAMIPAGPAGAVPHISDWGLAVCSASKNQGAAWLFMQWATSKETELAAHLSGIPSARKSVWKDPAFTERDPAPEWTEVSTRSYEAATYQWNPPVIRVDDMREVVGNAISAAILGKDIELTARRASSELNATIASEFWEKPDNEY